MALIVYYTITYMSINGDVLVKIAAGGVGSTPKDLARKLAKRNGLGGLGAVAGGAARSALDDAINRIPQQDLFPPDYREDLYDIPDLKIPKSGINLGEDPRINSIPRDVINKMPINRPKGGSQAGDIGRAAGRAARTVRDGAVDTAREVGRSVSDAVRGFGEGWRGR